MAVHRQQNPNDEFEEMSKEELDILYPLEFPEAMEAKLDEAWRGKQLGSAINKLKAIATYQDDAAEVWKAEELRRESIKAKEVLWRQEHRGVKVFQSVRMQRAQRVAKQRKCQYSSWIVLSYALADLSFFQIRSTQVQGAHQ